MTVLEGLSEIGGGWVRWKTITETGQRSGSAGWLNGLSEEPQTIVQATERPRLRRGLPGPLPGSGRCIRPGKNRDGHFTAEGALTHPWESPLLDGTSFATTGPKRLPSFGLTLCRQRAGAVWRKTRTSSISKLPETAVLWCQDTKAFRLQDTKALCGFVFQ